MVQYPTGNNKATYTIPDSVRGIVDGAFYDCKSLKSVTIGNGVTSIGYAAFGACDSLESITVDVNNTSYSSQDGVLFNKNKTELIQYPTGNNKVTYTIPDSVRGIGDGAFYDCKPLKSVTIGNGVTSIGDQAFADCDSLEDVWYTGSKTDRGNISIGSSNDYLTNATWHYNCCLKSDNKLHTYDNDCDKTCNTCGAKRTIKHTYKLTTTKKATLTANGKQQNKCTVCGNISTTGAKTIYKVTSFKLSTTIYSYDGKVKTPSVVVKDSKGNTLKKGTDYTVTYASGRKKVGTYKVTIKMKGKYTGTKTLTFKICKHKYTNSCDTTCNLCKATRTITHKYKTTSLKDATLKSNGKQTLKCSVCKKTTTKVIYKPTSFKLSATSYTYNGKVKTPSVVVKDSKGNTLKKGTDYTVTYASGRKNVGTYKVTIKMKGKYSGTKTLTFKIKQQDVSKCDIKLSAKSYAYDGKTKTPTVTVKNSDGTTLKKNTDYTVTYSSGRKNVGTYKVTVKMKNKNYTGTKTVTFKINPPKTTISKVTSKVNALALTITKKTAGTSGYEVQYSTSKTFKNAKSKVVSSNATTSVTISGLEGNKTYYVRVRTYKTVNGKKVYSAWSAYKSAKTQSEFKVLSIDFENILYSNKDVFIIKRNGKWGAVNQKNETIIPFEYNDYSHCVTADNYILMRKDGVDVLYNAQGKKVYTAKYSYKETENGYTSELQGERISSYNEGALLTVTDETIGELGDSVYTLNIKKLNGEKVASYEQVTANTTCINNRIVMESYGDFKELVVDKNGKVIRKYAWPENGVPMDEAFFGGWSGDICGGTYLEYCRATRDAWITNVDSGSSYTFYRVTLDGWTYQEHYGKYIIVYKNGEGYRLVDVTKIEQSEFGIDKYFTGSFVNDKVYDYMTFDNVLGNTVKYILVNRDGKWGYLSLDGKTEKLYDDATAFRNGIAMVKDGNKMYLINEKFEKISGNLTGYDSVSVVGDGVFVARKDGKSYITVYNK